MTETAGGARRRLAQRLRDAGIESAEIDARLLVGHALGLDHLALVRDEARRLTPTEVVEINVHAERRLAGEPVARIVGRKEFWGLSLRVGPATLVPRPDTETLVEAALAVDAPRDRARRIADLGTGSGALLLALLSEWPDAFGVGTDISEDAIATARASARDLGLAARAAFVRCDFGAALAGGFDLVVSNPPYIESGALATLPPEVRCDPATALDGGDDGLDAYRSIAADALRLLRPGSSLIVELGLGQVDVVTDLLTGAGLVVGPVRRDLGGIARALPARAP